jgi:hypothetical protein
VQSTKRTCTPTQDDHSPGHLKPWRAKTGETLIATRDPHRWAIFGGNDLIERSLRSFSKVLPQIDSWCAPRELYLIGGTENPSWRRLAKEQHSFKTHFLPEVSAAMASEILGKCAFGWIDYFVRLMSRSRPF